MTTLFFTQRGQGPDLVLLHGWSFHSDIWLSLLEHLTDTYRVTLIDLPGFGRSANSLGNQYTLQNITEQILQVAPQQAIYLGWSLGGLITSFLALHHSERVTRLIQVATTPCFVADTNWPGIDLNVLDAFIQQVHHHPQHALLRFLHLQCQPEASAYLRPLRQLLFQYGEPDQQALLGGLNLLRHTDLRQQLKHIICEQRYLFAVNDAIIPVEVAEPLQQWADNISIHYIEHSNHLPFLSAPTVFLQQTNLLETVTE